MCWFLSIHEHIKRRHRQRIEEEMKRGSDCRSRLTLRLVVVLRELLHPIIRDTDGLGLFQIVHPGQLLPHANHFIDVVVTPLRKNGEGHTPKEQAIRIPLQLDLLRQHVLNELLVLLHLIPHILHRILVGRHGKLPMLDLPLSKHLLPLLQNVLQEAEPAVLEFWKPNLL